MFKTGFPGPRILASMNKKDIIRTHPIIFKTMKSSLIIFIVFHLQMKKYFIIVMDTKIIGTDIQITPLKVHTSKQIEYGSGPTKALRRSVPVKKVAYMITYNIHTKN